jgi:hypothetical protein
MKIVVCGSMKLSKRMIEVGNQLSSLGHFFTLPRFVDEYSRLGSQDKMHSEASQNKINHDLIRGYYQEIMHGDAVLVVNEHLNYLEGYIGGNSFLEMGFAHVLDKRIYLMRQIPYVSYRDEILAMNPIVINGDLTKIK